MCVCVAAESTAPSKAPAKPKEKAIKKSADAAAKKPAAKKTTAASKKKSTGTWFWVLDGFRLSTTVPCAREGLKNVYL